MSDTVVDLRMVTPVQSYVPADRLNSMESFYPLRVFVGRNCSLVLDHPTGIFAHQPQSPSATSTPEPEDLVVEDS